MSDLINREDAIKAIESWEWQELYLPIHFKQVLEELPSVQQWIPASKRLPAFGGWYIVTVDAGDSHYFNPVVDWLFMENGKWHEYFCGRFEEFSRPVIAWMRSPEPYMPEPYKQAKMAREDRDE